MHVFFYDYFPGFMQTRFRLPHPETRALCLSETGFEIFGERHGIVFPWMKSVYKRGIQGLGSTEEQG